MKNKKGFTLIELLVVIAIIGILAAIVLVSLRGAPARAKDARIQSAITQVRTQAELMWAEPGSSSYINLCGSGNTSLNDTYGDGELGILQDDIKSQQGGTLNLVCYATTNKYCVAAQLASDNTKYFCIDSEGRVVDDAASGACDGTDFDCQ
jgi:prepilin-type N-terminal cleavage/methylation domain-containing protein